MGLGSGVDTYAYVGSSPLSEIDPFGLCQCQGTARVLQGNSKLIGKNGGIGTKLNPIAVTSGSAAVIPSQWGGKLFLRKNGSQISATSNGVQLFSGITDVMGGTSPVSGQGVRVAMQQLNPGTLILELPSAANDMGTIPVTVNLPDGSSCPSGTSPSG